jgi:hypothetical protein
MIIAVLVCGLVIVPNSAYTLNSDYSDLYIAPETNPAFFGGYTGGDGNTASGFNDWIDWSIGNGVPFNSYGLDDIVFSTNVEDFLLGTDWMERMRITKDGFVGIGRSAPRAELEINGGLLTAADAASCAGNPNNCYGSIHHDGSGGLVIDSRTGGGWADMHFQTNHTTKMFIESLGAVGIGTTSPGAQLHVSTPTGTGNTLRLTSGTVDTHAFYNSNGDNGRMVMRDANGDIKVAFRTDRESSISGGDLIINGGNVGVGTGASSSIKLYALNSNLFGFIGVEGRVGTSYGRLGHSMWDGDVGVHGWSSTYYAGLFEGDVDITGNLSKGSGTFLQPHAKDPGKEIRYAFFEGPEHAVFLRGTAKLIDGKAVIDLPDHFRTVAAEEGISVQFTPRSSDTFGLAGVEVSNERIVVEELKGEKHSYEFDYFITAVRAGFEDHEVIVENSHFKPRTNETVEEFEARYKKDDMTTKAMRSMLISNGVLTKDGKLNMAMVEKMGWTVAEKKSSPDRELRAEAMQK